MKSSQFGYNRTHILWKHFLSHTEYKMAGKRMPHARELLAQQVKDNSKGVTPGFKSCSFIKAFMP